MTLSINPSPMISSRFRTTPMSVKGSPQRSPGRNSTIAAVRSDVDGTFDQVDDVAQLTLFDSSLVDVGDDC